VTPKDLEAAFQEIRSLVKLSLDEENNLEQLRHSGLSPAKEYEVRGDVTKSIEKHREWCRAELRSLVAFPPHHIRHFSELTDFWSDGDYEHSVFLMTKFPDPGDGPKADQLQNVIDVVKAAVRKADFVPRIAQFPSIHPGLWDNVELHLVGCRQGIAIVEDQYLAELNPNVAMEWGWMRGMGKPVLFLAEEGFKHDRADLGDLLKQRFKWTDPQPGIDAAVGPWLEQEKRRFTRPGP
jgi:hypothetical protein